MPDLNHRFSSGKMNKDLDERLVPNGEYRDALNIEVATSEGSDMGTVQTLKGNVNASAILETIDPNGNENFYCVGSIVNEKNDKIYWLVSGVTKDLIVEYDYTTKTTVPVVVDIFTAGVLPGNDSGRALNFDRSLFITGINIIDDLLFWTDNYTEPKRIHIERCKLGSVDFNTQTQFYVRDAADINPNNEYIPIGPIIQEHITVIRKGPPNAPVLEMRNTLRQETEASTTYGSFIPEAFLQIFGQIDLSAATNQDPFIDNDGNLITDTTVVIDFAPYALTGQYPDFHNGDYIRIYPGDGEPEGDDYIRAQIVNGIDHSVGWNGTVEIQILAGTRIHSDDNMYYVMLEDGETLFKFKFPRFGLRYKYEDGEYSAFSPFSQVAFLPTSFDYRHKEGYNLGMVNNLRFLAIKDFVHGRQIPDDVISIDVLYKESNSPLVYTVKTVKRFTNDWKPGWAPGQVSPDDSIQRYSEWNAIGPNQGPLADSGVNNISSNQRTRGWTRITSEMIHAVLPSNQLLRPWDNVPRVALAQEVTGNRIVYANYLQNFNLFNTQSTVSSALLSFSEHNYGELEASKDIDIDIKIGYKAKKINETILLPEQKNAYLESGDTSSYNPAKSIKTLRTYQLGVVYIDEFGRETPVFSDNKKGENTVYLEKDVANRSNYLTGQLFNIAPEWAKYFKFFIKETSGEYYNLAMDRWYDAADGNIWLSFASSERNKVDEETFLILKKAHDSDRAIYEDPAADNYQGFIKTKARYKIIAISNEAPIFVKTTKTNKPTFLDNSGDLIATASGVGFPQVGTNNIYIDRTNADAQGWGSILGVAEDAERVDISKFEIRVKGSEGISAWYKIKNVSLVNIGSGFYNIVVQKLFKADIEVLSLDGQYTSYTGGGEIELVENIVENKPEFDGRFFVKIKKDINLIENIIQESSQSKNYVVSQALQSQYINPDSIDSGGNSQAGFEEWYSTPGSTGGVLNLHEISVSEDNDVTYFSPGESGVGEAFWDKASRSEAASTETNAQSNGWFIDKVEGFRPFKFVNYFFGVDDQYGMNDRWHPAGGPGGFIHANITLVGGENTQHDYLNFYEDRGGLQVLGTNTYRRGSYDDYLMQSTVGAIRAFRPQLYVDGSPIGNGAYSPSATGLDIVSELRNAPGTQNGKIVPSVGIDTDDNVIHLSYSGIGDEGSPTDVPENLSELQLDFSDFSSFNQYVADQLFINSICTPGTIWRWREDPDKILYVTKTPDYNDIDQDALEWGYNTRDYINNGAYYGVALYNYVIFQDYYKPHTHEVDGDPATHLSWASQGFDDHEGDDFLFPTLEPLSNTWGLQLETNVSSIVVPSGGQSPQAMNTTSDFLLSYAESHLPTYMSPSTRGIENNGDNPLRFGRTSGDWTYTTSASNRDNRQATDCHYYHPQRVKEFWRGIAKRRRYQFHAVTFEDDGSAPQGLGVKGPSLYLPTNPTDLAPHYDVDSSTLAITVKSTIPATPAPGIRSDGMYSGSELSSGDKVPFFKTEDENGKISLAPGTCTWQILESYSEYEELNYSSSNPAIWETEPKEQVDLNIYQEVGQIYPIELNNETNEQLVGPVHPRTFEYYNSFVRCYRPSGTIRSLDSDSGLFSSVDVRVQRIEDNVLYLCDVQGVDLNNIVNNPTLPVEGDILEFIRADRGTTRAYVIAVDETTGAITLARDLHNHQVRLPWHNCYSFGNGVESDRIRDDFNQVTIDNGPKASATLEEPYKEERRGSGLIYSGIYNSRSGINNLNQFIQAEKITKDLNPIYGTIQKLYSRDTNLVTFCEDKVFQILANKDALFNADGSSNVTSTDRVLGFAKDFRGDFGISKNPESFVAESYRMYFTDKTRGSVIRLSADGMTPISDYGMQDYFADNLKHANRLIGTFDEKKQEYNLTLDHKDYPIPIDPIVMATANVEIEAELVGNDYFPTNRLKVATNVPVIAGQIVRGPGLQPNTVVTGTSIQFGILYVEISPRPDLAEVSPLLGPSVLGDWSGWFTPITISQPSSYASIFSNTTNALDRTVSFSERVKGWVSFKSFIPEGGVSLNNTYYTFKKGILWEHHANETRNNFYNDQYDSSVEVLFNDAPNVVKSFQTLNYEGTQSRVTPYGTLTTDIPNDGEYWDNYEKAGWYVDNMITDLQEAGQQEFRDKENKWFSQIKGVTTQWLDDGKAGNIDTREFSYQGIDNSYEKAVIEGGYTSYDCAPCPGFNGYYGLDLNNREQGYSSPLWTGIYSSLGLGTPPNPTPHYQQASGQVFTGTIGSGPYGNIYGLLDVIDQIWEYFWQNPTLKFWDDYHEIQGVAIAGFTSLTFPLSSYNYAGHFYLINGIDFTDGWYATPYPIRHTSAAGNDTYFLTAEEAINYFSTNYSGNFYNGMSWADFKSEVDSIGETLGNIGGVGHMHQLPCNGTIGAAYTCQEVSGKVGEEGAGQYATLSQCENDPTNDCGIIGTSFACDPTLGCHEVTGSSGLYSSWCECIQNSSCCANIGVDVVGLDGIGVVSNSATQYYTDNCDLNAVYGCMDADGTSTIINNVDVTEDRPTGWTGSASNYNPLATVHTCDCTYNTAPVSFNCLSDGIGGFSCVDPLDGSGYYSSLNDCINDPNSNCLVTIPCDQTMPYQFTTSILDATGQIFAADPCDPTNSDGQIILGIDNLGPNAANITVELYEDDGFGGLGNLVFGNQTTQYFLNDLVTIQNLIAGNYVFRFEDDNDCVYTMPITVGCDYTQPQSCDPENFGIITNVTQNYSSTNCNVATSYTQQGEATITVPFNGYGTTSGSFTLNIKAYSNLGSIGQDITNVVYFNNVLGTSNTSQSFNFGTTVNIVNILAGATPASNYYNFPNGLQFQIEVTDSNNCRTIAIIEIPCSEPQIPATYDCNTGACIDPGNGQGFFSGANALLNCTTALNNGTSPCPPLSQNPCPQNDYIQDTDFSSIAASIYTPQLIHAWGGNYRCNNAIFPASCATSYVNEFFGDSFPYTSPFQPLTPGSYNIVPLAGTSGNTPNGGPWSPALIYNEAIPNQWSWFSSDKGSLPSAQGGPANYSQTPLANPPIIDANGHLRLSGYKDDNAKGTYGGGNYVEYPVTQGIYMEVLNLVPNTQYICVITFGNDWNNGLQAWPTYDPNNGTAIIPGSADVGWQKSGELWIGADLTSSGRFTANNGSTYAVLELDPSGGEIITYPSATPNYGGVINTNNISGLNFNQMKPGGQVGFNFTKNNNAATGDKDLLVISLVSYDVQHLSISSVCIFEASFA